MYRLLALLYNGVEYVNGQIVRVNAGVHMFNMKNKEPLEIQYHTVQLRLQLTLSKYATSTLLTLVGVAAMTKKLSFQKQGIFTKFQF